MSFFAIVIALLLEQVRPLLPGNLVHAGYDAWVVSVRRNFDTGLAHHGWLAWVLAVGAPGALVLGLGWLLHALAWPLGMLWAVAMLYVTLGFRQFSHYFTRIRDALHVGDEHAACQALAQWQGIDTRAMARGELLRQVLQYSVLAAHRHVFGVLFWFTALAALGLGPLGAVLYRMAAHLERAWSRPELANSPLQQAAHQAWRVLDWLPARLTALSFAVVGNFEDAIEGWRFYANRFGCGGDGVILAATAGALDVRLDDGASSAAGADVLEDETPPGRAPEVGHLRSVVALVWRAVVVWLLLLALLTLARLLG